MLLSKKLWSQSSWLDSIYLRTFDNHVAKWLEFKIDMPLQERTLTGAFLTESLHYKHQVRINNIIQRRKNYFFEERA